jgi:hypothetical protein
VNREIEGSTDWRPPKRAHTKRGKPRLMHCAYCGGNNPAPGTRSQSIDIIDKLGLFCTLRCAARYGVRAASA